MKFFRKIHLWLSVPFGIIITLICFSGAMLIFEPEITRSVNSHVYYVAEVKEQPLPMEDLMESVKSTLPDSVSITGVTVFKDKSRTYQVNLSKPRRASMFIDQYSGEITGKYERLGFFSTMFKLHRWLLDSANPHGEGLKVGKLLVGISTLIFVIALITGVIIWWPRARKNFKRSLQQWMERVLERTSCGRRHVRFDLCPRNVVDRSDMVVRLVSLGILCRVWRGTHTQIFRTAERSVNRRQSPR